MTPKTFIGFGILAVIMEAAHGKPNIIGAALEFDLYPTPTPIPRLIPIPRSWYFVPEPDYGDNILHQVRPIPSSPLNSYGKFSNPYQQAPMLLPIYQNNARCEFHSSLMSKVIDANRLPTDDPDSFYFTKRRLQFPSNHREDPSCPNPSLFLWSRQRSRSWESCPTEDYEIDLGEDFFPRFLYEKVCRCKACVVNNRAQSCHATSVTVTVFQRVGCRNGWAVPEPRFIDVQKSCFCNAPRTGF